MGLMEIDMTAGVISELMIRPSLLVDAARIGAQMHRAGGTAPAAPAEVARLVEVERLLELQRRQKSPAYRPTRHVDTLARIFAEARAADSRHPLDDQPKASGSAALRRAT